MRHIVVRFVREDIGQDLIEYVLLGALIATAVTAGAGLLGTNLDAWYNGVAGWVSRRTAAVPAN